MKSKLVDEFYTSDILATLLPLPPPSPFDNYESMISECIIETVHYTIIIEKINKLVSILTLTPFVFDVVEDLVIKSAIFKHGYSQPHKFLMGH